MPRLRAWAAAGGSGSLDPPGASNRTAPAALAAQLLPWDEIARTIEHALPQPEGRHWYAPASTASMICSYFLRRWFGLNVDEVNALLKTRHAAAVVRALDADRFDFLFEHYQLVDIVQPQIERQLQDWLLGWGNPGHHPGAR